jgi:hypothetical protein
MPNNKITLKDMNTKKYLKEREAHNQWWSNVCKSMIKGLSFQEALKLNNNLK